LPGSEVFANIEAGIIESIFLVTREERIKVIKITFFIPGTNIVES